MSPTFDRTLKALHYLSGELTVTASTVEVTIPNHPLRRVHYAPGTRSLAYLIEATIADALTLAAVDVDGPSVESAESVAVSTEPSIEAPTEAPTEVVEQKFPVPPPEPPVRHPAHPAGVPLANTVAVGAYMFAGFLTTRDGEITVGSRHPAGPVVEALKGFFSASCMGDPDPSYDLVFLLQGKPLTPESKAAMEALWDSLPTLLALPVAGAQGS